MSRDSLYGETILWSGKPRAPSVSAFGRVVIALAVVFAAVSLSFAVVISSALHRSPSGLVAFAAWSSAVGLFTYCWPRFWSSGVEYVITDRHVIWRRGPIRRSMERDAVSYALIRWNQSRRKRGSPDRADGTGDLVLVRAVPTGALRRTLSLTFADVDGPDRIWAVVRGVVPGAPLGDGTRPLPQRLDEGERVVWAGTPLLAPWTARRLVTAGVAATVAVAAVCLVERLLPTLRRLSHMHALPGWSFALFVIAVTLTVLLVASVAGGVGYMACIRPRLHVRATRYMVTNRRVLIRRGREELSLDRSRIADVIAAPISPHRPGVPSPRPGAKSLVDLFLVLDGPQARAFAPSGAFQEEERDSLLPVLHAIEDAETVGAILRPDVLATAA